MIAKILSAFKVVPFTDGSSANLRSHVRTLHPELLPVQDGHKVVRDHDNKVLRDAVLEAWTSK